MMKRASSVAVFGAVLSVVVGCEAPLEEVTIAAEDSALIVEPCTDPWCGRNTRDIGNGFIDHVFFDGRPNPHGQRFESWLTANGKTVHPKLSSRLLYGVVDGKMKIGPALNGSVMTLRDHGGRPLRLRFDGARRTELPNGVTTWAYRFSKKNGHRLWRPLCRLFSHDDDQAARYAFIGTRELIRAEAKRVQVVAPADGKMSVACPSSATGKMLGLGTVLTTAALSERPTVAEMTATLRAFTLSPTGERSYTRPGVGVMISVQRTGVNNHGESLTAGIEGYWDERGAICFDTLRIVDDGMQLSLWRDTGIPPCSEVDVEFTDVLVTTYRFFGDYDAYPPPAPPPPAGPGVIVLR